MILLLSINSIITAILLLIYVRAYIRAQDRFTVLKARVESISVFPIGVGLKELEPYVEQVQELRATQFLQAMEKAIHYLERDLKECPQIPQGPNPFDVRLGCFPWYRALRSGSWSERRPSPLHAPASGFHSI